MTPVHHTQVKKWRWPNFKPIEVACKGDGMVLIHEQSLDCLQKLRTSLGKPLIINSAYRSPEYNKSVGGAPGSKHLTGQAFDIRITPQVSREEIHKFGKLAGFKGFGDYNTFVHVDTGADRYWDLRT